MASSSVVKIITIWLVGFSHLASGQDNDNKGCITENLSDVGKTIRITNNNNQSWVKPLTTPALLDVAYITPQGTYNIMCTVNFNIPDVWHNLIITRSVDDKNFTNITVLVPELGNNCSKKFAIFHPTLYLRSHNNTVQWTNCTTDNTTGCITENLSEVVKTIHITNNNNSHHQSWVKPLTTPALLNVTYFTPQRTYNIMCTVNFNISDVWHNFIITLSVDDKNFPIITVLVPELGFNCSKKFTQFIPPLYLRSYNNTVQWISCTTDNTTVVPIVLTPPLVVTNVSTPPSASTCPPKSTHHPLFLASVVLFFILVVVVWFYVFITWRIHNQLLPERGSNAGQEEELRTYEEWNENWQVQSQL
nr:uncharacterized protein LOC128688925 [Cherax quadricarinatus]